MSSPQIKLLERVRFRTRVKGYSIRTEKTYVSWVKRFILFHGKRHPQEMGKPEIEAFLSYLAVNLNVAASTQNQAFNAILFLYNQVLNTEMPENINAIRSKKPVRLPTVMTKEETLKVIGAMTGTHQLMTKILYGSGLRALECVRLRVKDVHFGMSQIMVRDGKGKKDRITILPNEVKLPLKEYLNYVKHLHENDLSRGFGRVYLPYALERKYKNANKEWGWQYVFPAKSLSIDPRSGLKRRHHVHESNLRKAVKKAGKIAKITQPISCHTFRHHADFRIMPTNRVESGALLTPLQFKLA